MVERAAGPRVAGRPVEVAVGGGVAGIGPLRPDDRAVARGCAVPVVGARAFAGGPDAGEEVEDALALGVAHNLNPCVEGAYEFRGCGQLWLACGCGRGSIEIGPTFQVDILERMGCWNGGILLRTHLSYNNNCNKRKSTK